MFLKKIIFKLCYLFEFPVDDNYNCAGSYVVRKPAI